MLSLQSIKQLVSLLKSNNPKANSKYTLVKDNEVCHRWG